MISPAVCHTVLNVQQFSKLCSILPLLQIFNKERREERRQKLKDEMQRGYFDDFRDFRDKNGKIFLAPEKLIPADKALHFPPINVTLGTDRSSVQFPLLDQPDETNKKLSSLVCIAYRAGAQDMIESWAIPFSDTFKHTEKVGLYELALIESPIMGLWPFRSILTSSGAKSQAKYGIPAEYLYYFNNDTDVLRKALYMTNRLTGYVYLLDAKGRVRWRGSGYPGSSELKSLIACCHELIASG